MKTDIMKIFPKKTSNSISYILEHYIAFLPCLIFAAFFYSAGILTNLMATIFTALILEAVFCIIIKKALDLTITVRALVLCLCLPTNLPLWLYILGGALVFAFSSIRGFVDKYVTFEVISATLLPIFLIIKNTKTPSPYPSDTVLRGEMLEDISVLDLMLGTKSEFLLGVCIVCLLFAFVFLSIKKRISFLSGILFYASLIAVLGFLYTEGNINAIYFISFFALDPKILFASLFLVTLGATLPRNRKAALAFSLLGGALLGLITVKLGLANGIYYVILLLSLLSRPTELLIHKLIHKAPRKDS